jgi:diguanylate cyclase (GGDEF)-like protein/PAS domain S-box-containing protein
MANLELRTAEPSHAKDTDECVLLIADRAGEAERILDEMRSVAGRQFQVEWVTEISRGIDHLHNGGVGSVVLDLPMQECPGLEALDKLFQVAPRVPILILCAADAEEMARQGVQRGARDYVVTNDADGYRLRRAVEAMMDHRIAQAMLLKSEAAEVALISIGEAVLRSDVHGNIVYLNQMAETMTGWRREEALGLRISDVLRIVDGAGGATVRNAVDIAIGVDKNAIVTANCTNCTLIRRDGFAFGIENKVTLIHDPAGAVTGAVVAFHDVSLARAKSAELSRLARHDSLTGLPNRVLFNDRLTQAISLAVRQSKQLAVMYLDLDHFKKINDSLGHAVGDELLQSVARRLVHSVRRADTVSRLGGDEFVVLLSQVERGEDAAIAARKIIRELAAPHVLDNKSVDVSVSIGVSTYPTDGTDASILMDKADTALYDAKEKGRNTFQFFRPDMHARLAEARLLEADLRYALGRNEFVLHYQPKFNLHTGQITGVEALIRWSHPERGMVPPAQFVPIAEECGLMLPIGRWVLLEACRQSRTWSDLGLGVVSVAVNVSAAEFEDKDFLSGVRAVLIATGVDPPNLELEMTESALMEDTASTLVTLAALKAMGVQLAIDDFGTGYSSFTYLRRFPVDALKLDQSFVQEVTTDPGDSRIVSAMINIGNSVHLRVIAEGVESLAQLNFLQREGCGEGQGYYFSRPVGAEQAGKLLEAGVCEGMQTSSGKP